jgi:hypothetical protein
MVGVPFVSVPAHSHGERHLFQALTERDTVKPQL